MSEASSPSPSPRPDSDGSVSRRFWGWVPLVLIVFMLGLAVFGEKGLLRALQFKKQKEALEQEMSQLEATNAALRLEIDKLRNDRRYIEGIARKELGMVRADEMVYQFPTRPAPVKLPGAAEAVPLADLAQ